MHVLNFNRELRGFRAIEGSAEARKRPETT